MERPPVRGAVRSRGTLPQRSSLSLFGPIAAAAALVLIGVIAIPVVLPRSAAMSPAPSTVPTAGPTPAASSPTAPPLMSLPDLRDLLLDIPAIGAKTILAHGQLARDLANPTNSCPKCTVGTMTAADGRRVTVYGNEDIEAAVATFNSEPINAPMALHFAGDGTVELLGSSTRTARTAPSGRRPAPA